ncbi:MAG: hypothetical protein ACQR33_02965 [Candidatus Saccharibacteria bacterium]
MVSHRKPTAEAPQDRALYNTEVLEHQAQFPRTPSSVYLETLDGTVRYQIAVGAKNVSVHGLAGASRRHAGRAVGDVTPGVRAVTEASWPERAENRDIIEEVTEGTDESVPIYHFATENEGQKIGRFALVAAPNSIFLTFPENMRAYVPHDQAPLGPEDADDYFDSTRTFEHTR